MISVTLSRSNRYTFVRVIAAMALVLAAWLVLAVAPAGAAVQNLNLMAGMDEATGLIL